MKKLLTVAVILLFIGVAFAPSITIATHQSTDTNKIQVDFIGLNNEKSYISELSSSEVIEIKNMLDAQTELLEKATTLNNSLPIIKDCYTKLETYGLIKKSDTSLLFDTFLRYCDTKFFDRIEKLLPVGFNFDEIFSFLILRDKDRPTEISIFSIPGFIFLYLAAYAAFNHEYYAAMIFGYLFLMFGVPFILINIVSPLKFWVLVRPYNGEIWSIGLNGYQHFKNLYGDTDIIGFKGLRIRIPIAKSYYYIGHAMAITTYTSDT
ncbi:MAG: hypothetical protein JSW60_05245 [Thermoplasmatales archaeon]|nr:MAG: hypothetical protein JSW60_05245 [Thermoplasmatales archaeon]